MQTHSLMLSYQDQLRALVENRIAGAVRGVVDGGSSVPLVPFRRVLVDSGSRMAVQEPAFQLTIVDDYEWKGQVTS